MSGDQIGAAEGSAGGQAPTGDGERSAGQLDLERHGGRTPEDIIARVLAPILALTAAIWHNDKTSQPVKRSLTAYDH